MTDGDHFDPSRSGSPYDQTAIEELQSIRQSIDNIDAAVVHMLAERFKYTQRVGYLKASAGMPPSDPQRELVQIARLRSLAAESHLDPAFAEQFLNFIIAEVIHHHERIADGGSGGGNDGGGGGEGGGGDGDGGVAIGGGGGGRPTTR